MYTYRKLVHLLSLMFSETHYRPLPKEVIIKPSKIDGYGLFAKHDIPIGTELGITHVWAMGMWIRTPLGGFINHSDTPNAVGEMRLSDNRTDYRCLLTTDTIKQGEEITFYYSLTEYEGAVT